MKNSINSLNIQQLKQKKQRIVLKDKLKQLEKEITHCLQTKSNLINEKGNEGFYYCFRTFMKAYYLNFLKKYYTIESGVYVNE